MAQPLPPEGIPPLVTLGHPRLAQPSALVPVGSIRKAAFQERLAVLQRAMVEYAGLGIAAPQIGWFERFFLMKLVPPGPAEDEDAEPELLAWINPEIVGSSPEHNWAWEGCLSVPGLRGWIRRPAAVAVRGRNAQGERVSREYTGWPARVFQHEYDHLDGMLFPYRVLDPRHLVSSAEMLNKDAWPPDWPAPHAGATPYGAVVPE
jgi:peptide deformylase